MPINVGILVETQGVTELRVIVIVSDVSFVSTFLFFQRGSISSVDKFGEWDSSMK